MEPFKILSMLRCSCLPSLEAVVVSSPVLVVTVMLLMRLRVVAGSCVSGRSLVVSSAVLACFAVLPAATVSSFVRFSCDGNACLPWYDVGDVAHVVKGMSKIACFIGSVGSRCTCLLGASSVSVSGVLPLSTLQSMGRLSISCLLYFLRLSLSPNCTCSHYFAGYSYYGLICLCVLAKPNACVEALLKLAV